MLFMGFLDKLRQKPQISPPKMDRVEFDLMVQAELERLGRASAGYLQAEAVSLSDRLSGTISTEERDLADLSALTQIMLDRYDRDELEPWREITQPTNIWLHLQEANLDHALEAISNKYVRLVDHNWLEELLVVCAAVHFDELLRDTYGWLVDWRPAEPQIHKVKLACLTQVGPALLADMLLTLAVRELELIEGHGTNEHAGPQNDAGGATGTNLWQCISDTRVMRLAVEDALIERGKLPTDYVEQLQGRRPEKQIAFINDHQEYFDEYR